MKLIIFIFAISVVSLLLTHECRAQNIFTTEPEMCKMLGDTTFGTAAEVTFLPGQKGKVHTHAAQFVYAITAGTLAVHYTDGETQTYDIKAGDSFFAPPERPHWTENTGKEPMKFILVEFNEHPYIEMKKR